MKNLESRRLAVQGLVVAGVDEAGRGPLAGPVMAAAVILDHRHPLAGVKDSKKLSPVKREQLAASIRHSAIAFACASASVEEIDRINILQASLLAMRRAIQALDVIPGHVLVDGNQVPDPGIPCTSLVGGDDREDCIAAASILAKVERDHFMLRLHEAHPGYGFDRHKGYPTRMHVEAITRLGITDHHRRSYAPVKKILQSS